MVLAPIGEPAAVEVEVPEPESGPSQSKLLAVLGLVALAMAGALVLSAIGGDEAPADADEQADGVGTPTTKRSEPGREESPSGEYERGDRQESDGATAQGDVAAPLFVAEGGQSGEGAPWLGHETGYSLLMSSGPRMELFDLDRSTTRDFPAVGVPRLVVGEWLVFEKEGAVKQVRLSRPEEEAIELVGGDSRFLASPAIGTVVAEPGDDRQIWVLDRSLSIEATSADASLGARWRLVDLETGETSETVPIQGLTGWGSMVGPDIVTSEAGGVWTTDDGGYRRVADGIPLAADEMSVLVLDCSAPGECRHQWYDRRAWVEIDRPTPRTERAVDVEITGGRILRYTVAGEMSHLLDLETGDVLYAGIIEDRSMLYETPLTLSPDGRYLVISSVQGAPVIHDLESGTTTSLGPQAKSGQSFVFVETDAVGGA